ncbi:MAG TPA: patatin-like phospholipase family protein [Candidatus Dormibacteraeota bacterium]|nr:patatin-like phospholipase family protein [Candidatus Dormibacteraeota bacterium]
MRALVLGGGGLTGIAWEWGMIAGLAGAGVDLTSADLVVGTSAGSVVGAQLAAGVDPQERYTRQLGAPDSELAARMGPVTLARWGWAVLRSRDVHQAGRNLGRVALGSRTLPERVRRDVIATRLPVTTWPDRRLLVTAVDAGTGERVVFDRNSGVELVDAVASSCAVPGVWPPVTIDGRRFIDGGVHSPANADLAAEAGVVVILAPIVRGFGPIAGVERQAAALRAHARVEVVQPDTAAVRAIGRNVLDPARRPGAARAGRAQAASEAGRIREVWSD